MHATPSPFLTLAAVATGAAGLIHAAASGSHAALDTLPQLFALAAVAQVVWAVVALRFSNVAVVAAGLLINGAAVATLLLSRSVGISFVDALDDGTGLSSIGLQDGSVLALELTALLAVTAHVFAGGRLRLPSVAVPAIVLASALVAVPAMAQPHDHSSHAPDDAAVAAGDTASLDDHGGHDDAAHEAHGEDASHDDHGDEGHEDHHAGEKATDTSTPIDPNLPYPADFVSWLDTAPTPAQRDAAEQLIIDTTEAMKAYPDEASLQAAGFVSIGDGATGWEHYINVERIMDPRSLDPADIESVVLKVNPDGTKQVASAMYLLPFGMTMADAPDVAGDLTMWHDHQNLCWDGIRVVGTTDATGSCISGEFRPTQPMMHVWVIPHECGPFAGIEGSHGSGCGDHGH